MVYLVLGELTKGYLPDIVPVDGLDWKLNPEGRAG